MDKFIETHFIAMENWAQKIINSIHSIYGYCDAHETYTHMHSQAPPNFTQLESNGFNESSHTILEEIKAMIIELKIKGSVRQRDDGLFEYRSSLLGSIYGRTKEEIEQKLTKKLKEVTNKKGKVSNKNKKEYPKLSEFFETHYLPYKKQTLALNSIKSIQNEFNFIVGKGNFNLTLNKYTTANIETFLFSIPQTRKRQKIRGLINNIFKYAKRLGFIKNNPCENVEHIKHKQKIGQALSFQEQTIFFDNLFNDNMIMLNHKLYFAFMYLTGVRRSEGLDLKTSDVDFYNNTLHIRGTKTCGSNRTIPLFPLVKKLLQSITPDKNGLYFPIKPDMITRLMQQVKDNEHHPHELRHTFGTIKMCVEKLDAKTVSLYLGHTTTNMTLTRYTHPEQLDMGIFFNGSLSENEKLNLMITKYQSVLDKIEDFITRFTH